MKYRIIPFSLCLLRLFLLACLAWPCIAPTWAWAVTGANPPTVALAGPPAVAKTPDTSTFTHPLSFFLGGMKQETLRFTDARLDLPVPVPADEQVLAAQLHILVTPSVALNHESWLVVRVNGQVAGQFSLAGKSGPLDTTLNLPEHFFKAGYNTIEFRVAQHYTEHCEYPMASQIWSDVNLAGSTLTISLGPRSWQPTLADLNTIFNPSSLDNQAHLSLFHPPLGAAGPGTLLDAANLAVQGAALRYQYLPLAIIAHTLSAQSLQDWLSQSTGSMATAIFVGSPDDLSTLFASAGVTAPPTPGLMVLRWPQHPQHIALVLSGDGKALLELARAFAFPAIRWPPLQQAVLESMQIPSSQTILSPQKSLPFSASAYTFNNMGFDTQTRSGYNPAPMTLRIWDGGWQRKAQLRLHLAYAAGMSAQSALNVMVNGSQQDSIPLNNPAGGRYSDYTVTLYPTILHPGWNEVLLQPVLVPQSNGGDCRPFFLGNLWVTTYGDSVFQWMGGGVRTQQPDLAPLASNAYPFSASDSKETVTVQISNSGNAEISAALTLMGKLAQEAGHPFLNSRLSSNAIPLPDTSIYVGPIHGKGAWKELPGGQESLRTEYIPVAYAKPGLSMAKSLGEPTPVATADARLTWGGNQSGLAFLHLWRTQDRDHLLLTAEDSQGLMDAAQELVSYGLWAQMKGSLAWWRIGSDKLQTVGLTETPFRTFGLRGGLALWISRHPWLGLAGLLLVGLLFVLATRYALRRYAQRKQAE